MQALGLTFFGVSVFVIISFYRVPGHRLKSLIVFLSVIVCGDILRSSLYLPTLFCRPH